MISYVDGCGLHLNTQWFMRLNWWRIDTWISLLCLLSTLYARFVVRHSNKRSVSFHCLNCKWNKLVLVRSWYFSSVSVLVLKPGFLPFYGTGSGTSVLVPNSRYQGFGKRFSGGICICLILVLIRFHFGSISASNQVEPKALVLKPKITGT